MQALIMQCRAAAAIFHLLRACDCVFCDVVLGCRMKLKTSGPVSRAQEMMTDSW